MSSLEPPLGLLAELSHRCPLRCAYCSNPLELVGRREELSGEVWRDVFRQAGELGVLQLHLSGGEPAVRDDLEFLVAAAAQAGLYSNLITSGLRLDRARIGRLEAAGLDHVQLSVQDVIGSEGDAIAGYPGAQAHKLVVADWLRESGLPLTLNAVVHRRNIERVDALIDLAITLEADRIEIANVQYHGWARRNATSLLPTRAQLDRALETVERARARLRGVLQIDFVPPDYHAQRPKACMAGWGRRFLTVAPDGRVLPCHAAASIPDLVFANVQDTRLADIWRSDDAFGRFRGSDWMQEPCRSCERREIDFGGCRCQALAITGDAAATDPVCTLSPARARIDEHVREAEGATDAPILLRGT